MYPGNCFPLIDVMIMPDKEDSLSLSSIVMEFAKFFQNKVNTSCVTPMPAPSSSFPMSFVMEKVSWGLLGIHVRVVFKMFNHVLLNK